MDFTVYCAGWHFAFILSHYAGNWVAGLLAANRFVAIVCPHYYHYLSSYWTMIGMICFRWMVALAVNLPLYFGVTGYFIRVLPLGTCNIRVTGNSFKAHPVLGRVLKSVYDTRHSLEYMCQFP